MLLGQCHIAKATFIFVFVGFSIFLGCNVQASQSLRFELLEFRGTWGRACFAVWIADTPNTRAQGLMYTDHMPNDKGMLFVYPEPKSVSFWMKNTKIPLDMIFLSTEGRVDHIHSNAKPLDHTIIHGGSDIQYVVEINGGISEKLGISIGSFAHNLTISKERILNCTETE